MLRPEPVQRDQCGFWVHSAVLAADDETPWDKLPGAHDMEFTYRHFFDDAPQKLVDLYDAGTDIDAPEGANWEDAVKQWSPTPPECEGWFIVGIYDTEDGPYAAFARPLPWHVRYHRSVRRALRMRAA